MIATHRAPVSVAWARYQRRTEGLARHLGGSARFVFAAGLARFPILPLRYAAQAATTWMLLSRLRPTVVVATSPPILCPLVAAVWARSHGARYAVDTHTGAYYQPGWRWALPIQRWLGRRAAATILPDSETERRVRHWRGWRLVLPDPVPHLPAPAPFPVAGAFNVGVCGSYDTDEPVELVVEVARRLPDVHFYVTGDVARAPDVITSARLPNVHLTGYLHGGDYTGLLHACDALMVLTREDRAMNCAAFEAMAVGRPLILSGSPVRDHLFDGSAVLVENTVESVVAGVTRVRAAPDDYRRRILALGERWQGEWRRRAGRFAGRLGVSPHGSARSELEPVNRA